MIDFKKDGPLGYQNGELSMNQLRIVGVGQAGGNILDQIVLHGHEEVDLIYLDTDRQTLDASVVVEKMLLGVAEVRGLGCHGDRDLGGRVAAAEAATLDEMVVGYDFLIIAVGLGGGTGSALALALAKAAQKNHTQVLVVGTWPLTFEGARRAQAAQEDLAALRETADAVLTFHNDRLTHLPEASLDIRQAFHGLNQQLGPTIQALVQILAKGGLIQLGFSDLRSLYGRFRADEVVENCWAGHAEAGPGDAVTAVVRQLLESPLLAEENLWDRADQGILNVSGGDDLSLSDVQAITEELKKRLPKNFPVAVNANLTEASTGSLRLTLLLAATRVPEPAEPTLWPAAPSTQKMGAKEQTPLRAKKKNKPAPVKISDTQPIQVKVPPRVKLRPVPTETELLPAAEMASVAPDLGGAKSKLKKYLAKQEELPFELTHRGRFENSMETIYKGENLDQPTFRRRRLQIRL